MEMSDGIGFETWNATVRSLSSAVDRLERTAKLLAEPPWVKRLLPALEELNLHLRHLEEPDARRAGSEAAERETYDADPAEEDNSETEADEELPTEMDVSEPMPGPEPVWREDGVPAVPVRFGDPDAIACYGRRRRR